MNITQEYLKSILHYDPETGIFTWRERPASMFAKKSACNSWNARFSGKRAGGIRAESNGYKRRVILLSGRKYHYEHRLAWIYMTGEQPPEQIDHADRDAMNNKWLNLRDGTESNSLNKSLLATNTSGYTGVSWSKAKQKWMAVVQVHKKRHHVGFFTDKEKAAHAVHEYRITHGFDKGHGQPRPY